MADNDVVKGPNGSEWRLLFTSSTYGEMVKKYSKTFPAAGCDSVNTHKH